MKLSGVTRPMKIDRLIFFSMVFMLDFVIFDRTPNLKFRVEAIH
jgi:hypothetical protein